MGKKLATGVLASSLLFNQVAEAQWPHNTLMKWLGHSKSKEQETIIYPINPLPENVRAYQYDMWQVGTAPSATVLEAIGPFTFKIPAFNKKTKKDPGVHFKPGNRHKVITEFEETNKHLKKPYLEKDLSKYPSLPQTHYPLLSDLSLANEVELRKLNELKRGKRYLATGYIISNDGKSSEPFPLLINLEGNNFYVQPLVKVEYQDTTKVLEQPQVTEDTLEIKVDSTQISKDDSKDEVIVESKPDTGGVVPRTYEKQKVKAEPSIEFLTGYDSDKIIPLALRVRIGNVYVGPEFGIGLEDERRVTTPVINEFYGSGSDVITATYIGGSVGIDLGKFILNFGVGGVSEEQKVNERILRSNNQVVSSNTDNYNRKYPRGKIGLAYEVNKNLNFGLDLGTNFREDTKAHRRNGTYVGLRAGVRF